MAPTRQRSRLSNQPMASAKSRDDAAGSSKVPLRGSPSTSRRRDPVRKPRRVISFLQKQALIDNLQLEITERARRLRAQYHLQAQGLRSRIEIRVNRIPTSLRKVKMGDLMQRCLEQERNRVDGRPSLLGAKEAPRLAPQRAACGTSRPQAPERAHRPALGEVAGDKENEMENFKGERKARGHQVADAASTRPIQVLSPTSSNSRLATRDRPASPTKSHIARPGSPLKSHGLSRSAAMTSVLSSMVEKAKATRHGATRKVTAASEASSSWSGPTAAARGRRPATTTTSKAPPPANRPVTRAGHRASGTSETSDGSTGTVVRKPAATTKKTTMGAIRKGVAGGGTKKAATKPAAAPKASKTGGRVLRKRG